jgi:hypothetical protein
MTNSVTIRLTLDHYKGGYFYSHHSMPKFVSTKDDSDVKSQLSYVSEFMNKKKKIFGINESTLKFVANTECKKAEPVGMTRSLGLALSTVNKYDKSEDPSPFVGRESDNYKDNTKEKILSIVNHNK